jgi:hypothetical protein
MNAKWDFWVLENLEVCDVGVPNQLNTSTILRNNHNSHPQLWVMGIICLSWAQKTTRLRTKPMPWQANQSQEM